jgi:hypothetical protein
MFDSLADETKHEEKYFPYVYEIGKYVDSLPKSTNTLLLGLGGGSIAKQFINRGFSVDVCELDKRIAYVAKHYFYLDNKVNITIDDARHYIRTCPKKYDIIVLDMFKGEEIPNHVFTKESLEEMKNMLNPNGTILVNGFGYIQGKIGLSMRSIYKTFLAESFKVKVLSTDKNPDISNLLFYASLSPIKSNADFIPEKDINVNDAVVLEDEYPVMDILNAQGARRWRNMAISSFISDDNQRVLPVFY